MSRTRLTISAHRLQLPLVRPFVTAVRTATELETVLVEVTDDEGRAGWGEAPISRVTNTSTGAVLAAVARLDAAIGPVRDPREAMPIVAASGETAAARMAVDCALHDLAAQQAGVPLAEFLGAVNGHPVSTDMTLSVDTPDRLAATAAEHVAAGFMCLKVKLDAAGDQLERMRAVRDAVGDGVRLRVDANQAFSADEAVAVIRSFESAALGIEFVEQPVAADRIDALASVSARVGTPIMADEAVRSMADLTEVIRRSAAQLVNVKLAKSGGLLPAGHLLATARDAGLDVMVGCMMESSVGIGAAAALAASVSVDSPQDLDGGLWLAESAVTGGPSYVGDRVVFAAAPGLGVTGLATPAAG